MKQKFLLKTMALLCALVVGSGTMWGDDVLYSETFGTTGNKTNVSSYTGFSSSLITPTSSGWKISDTSTSTCSISGTSGSCNAYCGSTSDFIFNFGNKLNAYSSVKLSFNYYKGSGNGKANTLKLYISADGGTTYGSDLLPSNTGGTGWYAVTDISIPAASLTNLCIKFSSSTNTNRLDDILITGTAASNTNTTLSLSATSLNLSVGGSTSTLTATVTPEGGSPLSNPTITWSSSNEAVATVSGGTVTPHAEGTATITATYAGDNSYNGSYGTATVNVTDNRTAVVSEITEICSQKTLYIGGEIAFEPVVTLADGLSASDVTYSYVSADPETIRMNGNGTYTVLKTGTNIDITVTVTPISSKLSTHKPVTATFQHSGAYRYSGLTLPEGGNFSGSKEITMTIANNPQGPIYYTTNDNDPLDDVTNRILYNGAFTISATTTIKARVIDNNGLYSTLQSATYTKVPAQKDNITLAAGHTLSFTDFTDAGAYTDNVTNNVKTVYFPASDGDKYKFTGVDYGSYSSNSYRLQLKNTPGTITTSAITSTNGFKMTLSVSNSSSASVEVYVGETEKTAVNGAYYFSSGDAVTIKRSTGTPQISNITFTGLKPSRSVTFPDGNQTITVDGSTITKAATISPTGSATYSSSNTAVATVDASTGEVTAVTGGTAVITATVAADEGYEESTGSYTVTVNKAATTLAFTNAEETVELVDGTATFTATASPADASRTITYSSSSNDITVNSSTGAVTYTAIGDYTIKANATATDKYLAPSEASYTLHVVDNRKPVVSVASVNLSLGGVASLSNVAMGAEGKLSATYTKDAGFEGTELVTFSSSDNDVLIIVDDDFEALKGGVATVTVTITSNGNKMFTTVEKAFEVTVVNNSKTETEIEVMDGETNIYEDGDVLNLTYGTPVALDVDITNGYEGTIARALSNDQIVSVSVEGTTYTLTPLAVGSTTLTLSAAETANFAAASNVVLTINVAAPGAQSTATQPFSTKTTFTDDNLSYTEGMAWTANKSRQGFESNRGVQFNGVNTFTLSSSIDQTITKVILTVSSNGSNASISGVTVGGNTFKNGTSNSASISSGSSNVEKTFTGEGTGDIVVSFNNGSKSLWVKSIEVGYDGPVVEATIAASRYGTFCSEYPLNLPADNEDYKAYIVTNVTGATVTFSQISGEITGGVPFILHGNQGTYTIPTAASSDNEPDGNMLVGTLAPKYITTVVGDYTNFGLSGGEFKKINDGTVPANKAYLPVLTANVPSSGARLSIIFENEETGIKSMTDSGKFLDNTVYNLRGQRVDNPTKGGLYIVNGRKVVIK